MKEAFKFPTIGKAAQFVYACTGLMPQKYSKSNVLDETTKKTIQKMLKRLANEEGDLDKNLTALAEYFDLIIDEALNDKTLSFTITSVIHSLYLFYTSTIIEQGTYLSTKKSLAWLIDYELADCLLIQLHRWVFVYGVSNANYLLPDDYDWWLPSFNGEKLTTPIEKALRWIYQVANTSQERFHNPNKATGTPQQNAENASKWCNRNQLPSWWELERNLEQSLEQLQSCTNPKYQREFDSRTVTGFRVVLFFSRMATYVLYQMDMYFGREYVERLTKQVKADHRRLQKVFGELLPIVERKIFKVVSPYQRINQWMVIADGLAMDVLKMLAFESNVLRQELQAVDVSKLSFGEIRSLRSKFRPIVLAQALRLWTRETDPNMEVFASLYMRGRQLIRSAETCLNDVHAYYASVKASQFEQALKWLTSWVEAAYWYRQDEYARALPCYLGAFDASKQQIGDLAYLLVNQAAEVCAKNNRWREFKRIITWANHHQIKIRWYRGYEGDGGHEGAMKYAFQMLKFGTYATL